MSSRFRSVGTSMSSDLPQHVGHARSGGVPQGVDSVVECPSQHVDSVPFRRENDCPTGLPPPGALAFEPGPQVGGSCATAASAACAAPSSSSTTSVVSGACTSASPSGLCADPVIGDDAPSSAVALCATHSGCLIDFDSISPHHTLPQPFTLAPTPFEPWVGEPVTPPAAVQGLRSQQPESLLDLAAPQDPSLPSSWEPTHSPRP